MLRLCACILWICTGFHTHREVQGTPQTQNISSSMITMNDSIYTKILWNSGIWHLHVMYKQPGHTNNSPQKLSPWRRELLGTRNRNRLRSPKYPVPASDKYPALAASHFASLQNLAIKSLKAILSHFAESLWVANDPEIFVWKHRTSPTRFPVSNSLVASRTWALFQHGGMSDRCKGFQRNWTSSLPRRPKVCIQQKQPKEP